MPTSSAVVPDEIGGLLGDALKRSSGSPQRLFLEHSGLGREARAIAMEALAIIADLQERSESAWLSIDAAETTLIRMRNVFAKAIEASGKDPDEDPVVEKLDDALRDVALALEELKP